MFRHLFNIRYYIYYQTLNYTYNKYNINISIII